MSPGLRRFGFLVALFLSFGALILGFFPLQFWIEYGRSDPARCDRPVASTGRVSYRKQVEPILQNRCVVCHACYDAPCQLKLGSWGGIARGFNPALVFDGARVSQAPPTRLFIDA
jgi:hypothetical protein